MENRSDVAAEVAELRSRYEEHFAQVRDEFPRAMTAEEEKMREQIRLLALIDSHAEAEHLSSTRADEAKDERARRRPLRLRA